MDWLQLIFPVEWLSIMHQYSILILIFLKTTCLVSFTFVTFLIHWLFSPAGSCRLMLILFNLFWNYIWNIQCRWSLYICILCGLLPWDSSHMCKTSWLCLCIPSHCCWWFGISLDYELSVLSKVFYLTWRLICDILLLLEQHGNECII